MISYAVSHVVFMVPPYSVSTHHLILERVIYPNKMHTEGIVYGPNASYADRNYA